MGVLLSERRGRPAAGNTKTSYVAVVGPNAAWTGMTPRKFADFPGGTSHTILLVEMAGSDIEWTEPRDLPLDKLEVGKSPSMAPLSRHHEHRNEFFVTYDYYYGSMPRCSWSIST